MDTNNCNQIEPNINNLLNIYDRVMLLKLYVDDDYELKNMYLSATRNHNQKLVSTPEFIDAGFDLFAPGQIEQQDELLFFSTDWTDRSPVNKVDYKICCSAQMVTSSGHKFNTGYYLYPRSSISKTRLRLANSTGIIDSGYRGHIMAMFDVVNIPERERRDSDRDYDFIGKKFDRYAQICAPGLVPIIVEVVDTKNDLGIETERGSGGFGSTGR
jgi:dUTP pyrophosphatase